MICCMKPGSDLQFRLISTGALSSLKTENISAISFCKRSLKCPLNAAALQEVKLTNMIKPTASISRLVRKREAHDSTTGTGFT